MNALRYFSPGGNIPFAGPTNREDNIKMGIRENGGKVQIWLNSG
jgi:hypothetical protein